MLEAIIFTAFLSGVLGLIGTHQAQEQQDDEMDWSAGQARLNREFQRSERLETQQFNVDMWNMYNEYNTPANQLKRGMQAGINPNAIINGLSTVSDHVVSSSPMNGSQAQFPGSIADGLLSLNPEILSMFTQSMKTLSEKEGQDISNRYAPVINDQMIRKADAEIGDLAAKKGFTEEQTKQMKELFPLLKGKNLQELEKLKADVKVSLQQYEKLVADTNLANQQAAIAEWKIQFRERFGVAPDSGLIDGIIQLATSEEKGAETAEALFDTVFSMLGGILKGAANNIFIKPINALSEKVRGGKTPNVVYTADGVPVVINP